MRFNSLTFFLFLSVAVPLLWLLPVRARKWWLLLVSYVFYGSWHYPYLVLLLAVGALNHFGAHWIVGAKNRAGRGGVILAANVLILVVFKYTDWLVDNLNVALSWEGTAPFSPPRLILPLGISFFVFEGISYTVDIIRKREKLHRFWDFQLFMAFFPKLIAGPIMRAKELLPQIESPTAKLNPATSMEAGWLLGTGLLLKVLADGISPHIDRAFSLSPTGLGSLDVIVMALAFGIQIYFDFSSYTRMAYGSALLCGIRLVDNFNYPYQATSPVDFWNRWHMSLSRWIRDYLFFPLIGKKTGLGAMCRAALITMTICGIWHGAGWNYVLWGAYHGCLIAGYHVLTYRSRHAQNKRPQSRSVQGGIVARLPGMMATYTLVSLGWLWFRSTSLTQALALWEHVFVPWRHLGRVLPGTFYLHAACLVAITLSMPIWLAAWRGLMKRTSGDDLATDRGPAWLQGFAVGLMVVVALVYYQGQSVFIYFQF